MAKRTVASKAASPRPVGEPPAEPPVPTPEVEGEAPSEVKVVEIHTAETPELVELAASLGVEHPEKLSRKELIAYLEKVAEQIAPTPPPSEPPSVAPVSLETGEVWVPDRPVVHKDVFEKVFFTDGEDLYDLDEVNRGEFILRPYKRHFFGPHNPYAPEA